jgi:O-antigen/teichoic acid export membrane protein
VAAYACAIGLALVLPRVFNLQPGQANLGRVVLLLIALQVALYFRFSIYGAVVNGFEQYYMNTVAGVVANVTAAAVNVIVLWLGYGLLELVVATTIVRIIPLWFYRRNAFRVFPELKIRREYFRRERLRELTGFSLYLAAVDWAGRLAYTTDSFYLGIFMNTAAVAVYAIAQRLSDALLSVTLQLHGFLLPAVVNRAVGGEVQRQQSLMVKATRLQLAIAACVCGGVAATADVLIQAWIGPGWSSSAPVTQLLALTVVCRALMAMPMTVLQGTGHHKYVAAAMSACAIANLILSIPLVQLWGLVGVTLGTAIPVVVCAGFVFTRACRVVGLSVWRACVSIIWPPLWPGVIVTASLSLTRHSVPPGLIPALGLLLVGAALYVCLFVRFGLQRNEREWFLLELKHLTAARRIAVSTGRT